MAKKRTTKRIAETKQQSKRLGLSIRQLSWERRFSDLKAFKKEYGHCNVPLVYPPNPALGCWVMYNRHRKKHGIFADEKVRRLNAIGFCWERKLAITSAAWKQRIKDLKLFKKKYGHCNVLGVYSPNPALGIWVANVRRAKKQGAIKEEKILILNALGFCWERYDMSKRMKKQR